MRPSGTSGAGSPARALEAGRACLLVQGFFGFSRAPTCLGRCVVSRDTGGRTAHCDGGYGARSTRDRRPPARVYACGAYIAPGRRASAHLIACRKRLHSPSTENLRLPGRACIQPRGSWSRRGVLGAPRPLCLAARRRVGIVSAAVRSASRCRHAPPSTPPPTIRVRQPARQATCQARLWGLLR